jgi:hypothetical protein
MYYRSIPGNKTLEQIQNYIANEEDGASKFVENKVALLDQSMANVMKFVELDVGVIPKSATLVLAPSQPPAEGSRDWEGPMLVQGAMKIVDVYR